MFSMGYSLAETRFRGASEAGFIPGMGMGQGLKREREGNMLQNQRIRRGVYWR
jgi:hypothetical protein